MKITKVLCAPGRTGFYFDDQRAIKQGADHDGMAYIGKPVTPGFSAIRQAGEAISVMLVLEDGQIAWGDCAAVQYSGAGGRDPLFLSEDFIPFIMEHIAPVLTGAEVNAFRPLAEKIDHMEVNGKRLHTAIRYGVTQAILDAAAKSNKKLMAEIIAEEYHTSGVFKEIPIFCQSGDDRYNNVDKMIVKGASAMPHALINHVETKLGKNGEILQEYCRWMKNRILELRPSESYAPIIHIDVYGTIGAAFGNDNYEAQATYIESLVKIMAPFKLRIEGPMDVEDREKQMIALKSLREEVDRRGIAVELVADEWCNTYEDIKYFADNKAGHMIQIKSPDLGGINNIVESVLYCKKVGIGAYQGGSCNETDRTAQVCVHLALATGADQMLCKPGMGVDEGYTITYNEMERIIALAGRKRA